MSEPAEFDVIVVGAGINGCGTFRDLSLQGLRVLLLDQGDICGGASAASSRLMHGGLKYLETGQLGLVRESLTERNMLLATAQHYVQPLECIVPVTSVWGGLGSSIARFAGLKTKINDRGFVITALGLALYGYFGLAGRYMPRHRMLGRAALRRLMPAFADAIIGAGVYHEARISHAERLGLELVLDAEAANPQAQAESYADLIGAEGGILSYRRATGEIAKARGAVIVNSGGAWIDRINARLGIESHLMGGSRGSHLIVDNPALLQALDGRMIYFGTADGRVNLVYPFEGKILVGATDIPQHDPDLAQCSDEEDSYLRAAVATIFPNIPVTPDQVVFRFAGTRPLPLATDPSGPVTRDHSIVTLHLPQTAVPVHCLIGGKWTTFRAFSEQAADRVLADLGMVRRATASRLAIGGARNYPSDAAQRRRFVHHLAGLGCITNDRAEVLLSRYGTRAEAYVSTLGAKSETMLQTVPDYAAEELCHIAATEKVMTLEDLIHRRTLIALTGYDRPDVRAEIATHISLIS